ncbi:MAG: hypothetical protein ACYCVB_14660, partial [Bacilli bacterium]
SSSGPPIYDVSYHGRSRAYIVVLCLLNRIKTGPARRRDASRQAPIVQTVSSLPACRLPFGEAREGDATTLQREATSAREILVFK